MRGSVMENALALNQGAEENYFARIVFVVVLVE